jgi:PAS domain S-box-containing protein
VQRAQERTVEVLIVTGLLGLCAAALLGVVVTRSITRPLASLETGTRALYEGRLGAKVEVEGNDELTHLAVSFNRSSKELQEIYAKLANSEAHFRSLIENAADLIMIVSRTGDIVYASPSSLRLLGSGAEPVQGRPIREFVHPEDVPLVDPILAAENSSNGEIRGFELRVRSRHDSFRILEGVAKNLPVDQQALRIVINARDVTDRRAAEHALRDREEQLRQAQKLEGIGLLAGGVAHDFNNLLTVINGYSAFLLQTLNPSSVTHGFAQSILQAGERAADLTRQLLAFSRKQILRPEVLDLNQVATEAGRLLRRLIGEDIELISKLSPELGRVEADQNQVHQVLMNLSTNARDAMPRGGTLTIETRNVTLEDPAAGSGTTILPGRYVCLTVRDTGHGMDEATQQRIFEPFFTTKEQGKGTGLGLASVYGIVRQSGGHIAVESEIGRGTTFQIFLPRIDREAEPAQQVAHSDSVAGSETILLVEDEIEVRKIASQSLRHCGYRVIEAADAKEALLLYERHTGDIRILLTDVVMPGMTGVELSRRLLDLDSQLKVIYVSGYADGMQPGGDGASIEGAVFLQKPYQPRELAAKVREVLAG